MAAMMEGYVNQPDYYIHNNQCYQPNNYSVSHHRHQGGSAAAAMDRTVPDSPYWSSMEATGISGGSSGSGSPSGTSNTPPCLEELGIADAATAFHHHDNSYENQHRGTGIDSHHYNCGSISVQQYHDVAVDNGQLQGDYVPGSTSAGQNQSFAHLGTTVRPVKRRNTANKKERRRTQSINNAFADLRDCIPNVPADTKLSKIKTLRLACSYIGYLTAVLDSDEPPTTFRAELMPGGRRSKQNSTGVNENHESMPPRDAAGGDETRRSRGRTGWPQHVWALELKQEQPPGL
ncbi:uncharacterized protein LOC105685857 isoform X1 [Athalia rosae]|uniref:uncharacterized protein LOC105685857 isoform X1 n=2 Tax=Athalia rosae TaxID=37344 RepID=UPI002033392F|nr:uncharacterized protein LOC105685857 isoform X1 [Athalia rosae]